MTNIKNLFGMILLASSFVASPFADCIGAQEEDWQLLKEVSSHVREGGGVSFSCEIDIKSNEVSEASCRAIGLGVAKNESRAKQEWAIWAKAGQIQILTSRESGDLNACVS